MSLTSYIFECSEHESGPPRPDEVDALASWLRSRKLNPVVVGSAAVAHHVGEICQAFAELRPTNDLDIFVSGEVPAQPPPGWTVNPTLGVDSWTAESGGQVDFLTAGHRFPSGVKVPGNVSSVPVAGSAIRVASLPAIWRIKLASGRAKDTRDLAVLAVARGIPTKQELGRLTPDQQETLEYVQAAAGQAGSVEELLELLPAS